MFIIYKKYLEHFHIILVYAMVELLTEEEILKYKKAFKLVDQNNDDKIEAKELENILISLGKNQTNAELQEIINNYGDSQKNITFSKFLEFMGCNYFSNHVLKEEEIIERFRVIDKDKKGVLSVDEIRGVLRNLGEAYLDEEINEMIDLAETDQNGNIKYEIFVQMFMSN